MFFPENRDPDVYNAPQCPFYVCTSCGADGNCSCDDPLTMAFTICDTCRMVLPQHLARQHGQEDHGACALCGEIQEDGHFLSKHPDNVCSLCGELEMGKMLPHLQTRHALHDCDSCKGKDVAKLFSHLRDDHRACPLCRKPSSFDSINKHLAGYHEWDCCNGCDNLTPADFERHLLSDHSWVTCPFPECHPVMTGKLWAHIRNKHAFQRCPGCPPTEADFARAVDHTALHSFEF
ncbi:hypothetical protein BKA67DRAFT_320307 [Truncatella angustata]|uniref:Uncharacterized protein n=1 Tax=Truncatella angustata TaxID=152316 RepID=A0A9P8UJM2_9PEZI|nr:uncharacterized protein BKA67DRAFT_320307 [Truncatella angustata]KAH6653412.1 hypothetical protein BKA67DRAFT_320307 [Truncatella angustata]